MALGLIGAISILALVPRRGGWFARMGAATMVVYLFHGFPVRFASYAGLGYFSEAHPVPALILTTVVAIALSLFLASPPVRRTLVWLADPVNSWRRHRAA